MVSTRARLLVVARLLAAAVLWITGHARADDGHAAVDRSTPRRAIAAFQDAAEAGDDARAAEVLDLRQIPPAERATRGPAIARMLYEVLDRALVLEPARLSDDAAGRADDGAAVEQLGAVPAGDRAVPIVLARTRVNGEEAWLFSSATVARIPKLHERYGGGWLETRMPAALRARTGGLALWQWLGLLGSAVVAFAVGRFAAWVGWRLGVRVASKTEVLWDDEMVATMRSPARAAFALVAFRALLEPLALSAAATEVVVRLVGSLMIAVVGWVAVRMVVVLANAVERRAVESAKRAADHELRSRGITTQVRVLRRVVNVAIGILVAALVLLQFEVVRDVGLSLLASAGLAGVVVGFAAQRTIGSLVAGIQISATQPIRIGDVVIVEKEWGVIEEVTLTYVVVKVWDERRLVVPVTRFLEQPFENWTKVSPQLHGTVFLHVDWSLPIDALRAEVDRIVTPSPDWDGRTKKVHVTDCKDRTLEVRVLVSAADAGKLWDLRTHVREQLVRWLQGYEGGRCLPRLRLEGAGVDGRERVEGAAGVEGAAR